MKSTRGMLVLLIVGMLLIHGAAIAQVDVGTPPFRSFGGGPDIVNLGNLNVHYSIPVHSRPGRGMPFNYSLAYDSSVWRISGSAWTPASSTWGLTRDVSAAVGYVTVSVRQYCLTVDPGLEYTFSNFVDSAGTSHHFSAAVSGTDCKPQTSQTVQLDDGSGITITVDTGPSATVTLKSGDIIHPVLSSNPPGGGNQKDSNGNQITSTVNGTTTKFFDTLSSTVPVLIIDASVPTSVNYQYASPADPDPSNPPTKVTVTYLSKPVKTNFGCNGVNEYGGTNGIQNSLVDKITLADGSYYQFTYEATPSGPTGTVTGRVASVRLPTGGTISYSYTGGDTGKGIMCIDGSTSGFDRTTPDSATPWHYLRTGTSPAYTTTVTTPPDPATGQTNQTVLKFQGNFETERDVYQGSATGTPLETVFTCYNGNGITNPSSCLTIAVVTPFAQITKFKQLNGGPLAEADTHYDGYADVTEADQYDFGASTPARKTLITYDTSLSNGIVDHPSSVIVQDGSGNMKAKTTYAYDETTPQGTTGTPNLVAVTCNSGTKCRGNMTTITTYSTSTATLTRTTKYYDTGNVYQSQDVNGQWTTFTYGTCGNSFLTNVSRPLSLSRSATWNCTGGVMTSSTDENSQVSYVNYTLDPDFWRPESAKDPLLNVTSFSYPSLTQTERSMIFNSNSSTVDAFTALDSMGRVQYSQQKQSPSSNNYDSVQQTYDAFGRPYQVTMPYVGAKLATPPGGTPVAVTTSYDAMGRPIQVADGGNGAVNVTYNQNDVLRELDPAPPGEAAKKKQLQYDGLGRLTSVCEITTGSNSGPCAQTTSQTGYWTKYIYDTAPNVNSLTVTQNTQSGGGTSQTRTYIYDMLGRLTQEANPETGTTNYFYDSDGTCGTSNGDLVKRVDAVQNVTCYAYDALHRVTAITYPSGSYSTNTDKKNFVYDVNSASGFTLSNTKGRLAEAYTCPPSGSCTTKKTDLVFSYSARGEVTDTWESTPHSSGYYHLTASYFPQGGLNALSTGVTGMPILYYGGNSDPSGLDGEGRITKVTASSGQNPVTGVTYTTSGTAQPIGSLTQVTYGSQDRDNFSYDTGTGRMNQYKFSVGATPQTVTGNLGWNANGTLASLGITDQLNSSNSQSCTYSYDDLARIAGAHCGTVWYQDFSFDPFGNITKNANGGTSFLPTYSLTTNQFLSIPGCTPAFDANGFPTNDCDHTYTWDAAGNPLSVDAVTVTYDALGRLVEELVGSTYTQTLYGPTGNKLALTQGQTLLKALVPLPLGGQAVYKLVSGQPALSHYRHPDWLGSARLSSTPTQTLYYDVAYAPYGENYGGSGSAVALTFTGQTQDTVAGLYDFLYRRYNPNHGRWPMPDPAGLGAVSMETPQTWNRYAYVANNPLNATDLLGLSMIGRGADVGADGFNCSINGAAASCVLVNSFASAGGGGEFGVLCATCSPFGYGTQWNVVGGHFLLNLPSNSSSEPDDGICPPDMANCDVSGAISTPAHWADLGTIVVWGSAPANNDSFWGYLLSKPWVVSWILPVAGPVPGVVGVGPAGGVAWNPKTHNLCVGAGLGASAGHNAAVGPLLTSSGNVDKILSGWSVSGGGNLPFPSPTAGLGWQVIANSSGVAQGPTAGVAGLSGAVTWSACANLW